jgi:hypothetical protein
VVHVLVLLENKSPGDENVYWVADVGELYVVCWEGCASVCLGLGDGSERDSGSSEDSNEGDGSRCSSGGGSVVMNCSDTNVWTVCRDITKRSESQSFT